MYSVFVKPKAKKHLDKIDEKYRNRIKTAINFLSLQQIPFKDYDVKKVAGIENTYRIRIGVFRFIYTIISEKKTIIVLKIERRDEHTYD